VSIAASQRSDTRTYQGLATRFAPLLIAPAALAILGAWGLTRANTYSDDEIATRWAAQLPLHNLFHLLGNVDAVHGLYYLAIHVWIVVGRGPVALRLPSLLAAVATAGVVTALGRRLARSTVVGVTAGLLYATSPLVMIYAQTARSYAIVSLVVALMTLVLVRALDEEADEHQTSAMRRWVVYGFLAALAGWLNEIALLALVAHAVTVAVTDSSRRARRRWLVAAASAVVAVSPLLVISERERNAVEGLSAPTLHDLNLLVHGFFGPYTAVMVVTIGCTVVALVSSRRAWRSRKPVGLATVALPMLAVPPLLVLVESEIGTPLYAKRYVAYSIVGLVLLVADGAAKLASRLGMLRGQVGAWAPGIAAVLVVLFAQLPYAAHIRTPDSRERNFAPAAGLLAADARPGDGVLFVGDFFRLVQLGYPRAFSDLQDVDLAASPFASNTFRGTDAALAVTRTRALACGRIWMVGQTGFVPMPSPQSYFTQIRDLLYSDFSRVELKQFHGVAVSLWVRDGPTLTQRSAC
jgi:mannosyltransferase